MNQQEMDALRTSIAAALSRAGIEATPSPDEGDVIYGSHGDVDFALSVEPI